MSEYVDFSRIDDGHVGIHDRLVNWARWCDNRPRLSAGHPMFRWARSADHWAGSVVTVPVDNLDAAKMEKAVFKLPEKNKLAVRWWYVYRSPPRVAARALACSMDGLSQLVRDGRQMLVNRA
jgi:hypothetical protein